MNPLMQKMGAAPTTGGINPQIMQVAQSAKRMMGMLKTVKDPQSVIMQAAQKSPQLGAVMQMCHGKNPQDVFIEECKQHGVNPDAAINQIKQILS